MSLIIDGLTLARLQEPVLRMRHNVLMMHRNLRQGFSTDTPDRIRGYDYANFLSLASNTKFVVTMIVTQLNRSFGERIKQATRDDQLINYVIESRNAEEHSIESAEVRPAFATHPFTDQDGSNRFVFQRRAWELRPLTSTVGRKPVVFPVPTKHRGHDISEPTPESLAAYYFAWWAELFDFLVAGKTELPKTELPRLIDFYQTANGEPVPAEVHPEVAKRRAQNSGFGVIFGVSANQDVWSVIKG